MISRERVSKALRGEPVDRVPAGPLAVHFCAKEAGVSLQKYTTDAKVLADCVIRYAEKYRPDAIWVSADTWVTAEAMGAKTAFPGPDQPMGGTGEAVVREAADVDRIPAPDPSRLGRMPLMLEAMERIRKGVGNDLFVVSCFDQAPFSLACSLMGISEIMMRIVDDASLVEALMERCVEHGAAYGAAMASAGSDMLSTGDSPAGLIGPKRYREMVLPAEQKLFARLKEKTAVPCSLHICGDATGILPDMAQSGADILEIDHKVDLAGAFEAVGNRVALWGNLDPVSVLEKGTPESVRAASKACLKAAAGKRFVLSSGCTISVDTPEENLRAHLESVKG